MDSLIPHRQLGRIAGNGGRVTALQFEYARKLRTSDGILTPHKFLKDAMARRVRSRADGEVEIRE